jgi:hypothetical protein
MSLSVVSHFDMCMSVSWFCEGVSALTYRSSRNVRNICAERCIQSYSRTCIVKKLLLLPTPVLQHSCSACNLKQPLVAKITFNVTRSKKSAAACNLGSLQGGQWNCTAAFTAYPLSFACRLRLPVTGLVVNNRRPVTALDSNAHTSWSNVWRVSHTSTDLIYSKKWLAPVDWFTIAAYTQATARPSTFDRIGSPYARKGKYG